MSQSALLQMFARKLRLRGVDEEIAIIGDGEIEQIAQTFVFFFAFHILRRARLEFHSGARRQMFEGIAELPALFLHHEFKNVAAFVALTEAAPRSRFGPDHKRWRVLGVNVERA